MRFLSSHFWRFFSRPIISLISNYRNPTNILGKEPPPVSETCDKSPAAVEKRCEHLKDHEGLHKACINSHIVKETCNMPKHLRPPWLTEQEGKTEKGAWYACYKNESDPSKDYCACAVRIIYTDIRGFSEYEWITYK